MLGSYTAKQYCNHHDHVRYCEILIHSDGSITEARPSHQEALIRIIGIDRDTLWKKCSILESAMDFLCRETNCISVWYDYIYLYSDITDNQIMAIERLISSDIVGFDMEHVREVNAKSVSRRKLVEKIFESQKMERREDE